MSFEFSTCITDNIEIPGLFEIKPKVFGDERGYFFESYNERDFFVAGIKTKFVQDNESFSAKGVLRGLHFQIYHPQAKLVRVVSGRVFDVALDLRNDSPSFGKWYGVLLDGEQKNQFYIPRGFAHGFFVLSDTATFAYKCDDFYDTTGEGGIFWADKTVDIFWQSENITPLLSDKDLRLPHFDKNKKYFSLSGEWLGE